MTRTKQLAVLVQFVVVLLVGFFVYDAVAANWSEFRALDLSVFRINPLLLGAAAVLILVSYVLLIAAWRTLVIGWGNQVKPGTAAAIWCISNMGRYLPGKVWAVAGLAVLAGRAGVDPIAAMGSAVIMQALAIGTGVVVASVTVPGIPVGALALALGVSTVAVASLSSRRIMELLARASGRELRPVSVRNLAVATTITAASWMVYGIAFRALLMSLVPDATISLYAATGFFAASYIVGFVSLFAPGGIGIREGAMIALLTGPIGGAGALVVAVSSRLLFTATEIAAVLLALPFAGDLKGEKET